MKKSIFWAILFMATVFPAYADSPLTSTVWWQHYKSNSIVVEANKSGCTERVRALICDDSQPLEFRLAAVNALGWNVEGQNNFGLCLDYYMDQIRVRYNISIYDTIADAYIHYSPETMCVFAYLIAMDNYFDVDYALSEASYANQLQPQNKSIAMICALIAAQKNMDTNFCSVYRIVASVAYDKTLIVGGSQYMVDEIMDYVKGYLEYCN